MNKKYKLILFDFDGVISDSLEYVVDIIFQNVAKYTKHTLSKKQIEYEIRNCSIFEIMKKYNINKFMIPLISFKIKRDLSKRTTHSKLYPRVKQTLQGINDKNIKNAIMSSNSQKSVNSFLNYYNIDRYFSFVYTSSSFLHKEKNLKKILKKYNLDSSEVLYIGDEIRDIVACKKIGVDIACVVYGFNSKKLLESYEPNFLIESLNEIIDILDNQ